MITAFLFPLSLGVCALFLVIAALQGDDPQLQAGILATGALTLVFGAIHLRRYGFPRQGVVRRFARTRRGILAVGLTAAAAIVGIVALDGVAGLKQRSTPGALDSQRAMIAAHVLRFSELERRREADWHDYRALAEQQTTREQLIQARWELRVHESAGGRLLLVNAVVSVLALMSLAAWIAALRPRSSRCDAGLRPMVAVGQPA